MFPHIGHVETVVLLSHQKSTEYIYVDYEPEQQERIYPKGATYKQIKEYVRNKYDTNVSTLAIAQIKRKCGIEMGENYNKASGQYRQPKCPVEKEKMMLVSVEHFKMALPWRFIDRIG